MLYLDTSLLVAIFTQEIASERSRAWLKDRESEPKSISWWVETEAAAALSMKVRSGQINTTQHALFAAGITRLISNSFTVLDVKHSHFLVGARMANLGPLGLRAGDALHLAIAKESGSVLCTLDKGMAKAGAELGVATELI